MAEERNVVAGTVDALVLVCEVVPPVLLEVLVADDGAHPEDSLGAVEAPASTGDVHPVLHQMPAGPLDNPSGDRPPALEGGGIVEILPR